MTPAVASRALFQLLLILGMMLGPLGNLGALQPLDGACASGCPCDSEVEDPCADDADEHSEDEDHAHDAEPASDDPCADDCSDCDCDAGVVIGVTAATAEGPPAAIGVPRAPPSDTAPTQGRPLDIFIPPRR